MPRRVIASVVRVPWHTAHGGYDRLLDYLPEVARIGPPTGVWATRVVAAGHRLARSRCPLPFYPAEHFATDLQAMASRHPVHVLYGDEQFWFARHRTAPTVVTYHQPAGRLAQLLTAAEWRELTSRAGHVITLDPQQRGFFADLLDPQRVHLVPHGIDTIAFTSTREPETDARPLVLTVGWWLRDWDVLDVVHRYLHDRYGQDIDLAVVTRRAAERSWHPAVRVLEHVSEGTLTSLYQRAAVVLLPLRDATANNALLEAMACGAPVVATDVGGIGYYAGAGPGVVLTEPGDALAAAEAVETLLAETGTTARALRCAAARERAEQFTWPLVADQIRTVYRTLEDQS